MLKVVVSVKEEIWRSAELSRFGGLLKGTISLVWCGVFFALGVSAFAQESLPASSEATAGTFSQSVEALEGVLSPTNYIVGPGDRLALTIWGQRTVIHTLSVTPEGVVIVPDVGVIAVGDLTLEAVQDTLIHALKPYYRGRTIQVNLVGLRTFQVFVLGQVHQSGIILARPTDRVSEVIQRAGGIQSNGSTRAIEIRRQGQVVHRVDLSRFRREGRLDLNPHVKDGDVIFVPYRRANVYIHGAVHSPGTYEFIPGDTLEDLITLAGGLKPEAYLAEIEIVRFLDDQVNTKQLKVSLDRSPDSVAKFALQPDDQVFIRSIPEWHIKRTVWVQGEVKYPGIYAIAEGKTTLAEVIAMAGGFMEDASLLESRVIRQRTAELLDIPEQGARGGVPSRIVAATIDPEFERLKGVPVSDMSDREYEYFKMKSREQPNIMVVDFLRLFNDHDPEADIILRHGDVIWIPRNRQTVTVVGEVVQPGAVVWTPGLTVQGTIAKAGGFAQDARRSKIRVIKGNTRTWLPVNQVQRLEPGDTIWIPEKPDRDWWRIFLEGMTVAGQAATIALLFTTILKP